MKARWRRRQFWPDSNQWCAAAVCGKTGEVKNSAGGMFDRSWGVMFLYYTSWCLNGVYDLSVLLCRS